ncbi:MAG: metal-dependent hydrolase [Synergistetes bacterium]|nr:metal-dependent hydrolase [Synergistota bacterium]
MAKVKFLGHAAFYIEGEGLKALIDPFLRENPQAAAKPEDFNELNYIFLTHGHGDHLGDSIEIAKKTGATIVAVFELANYCSAKGAKIHPMHVGGRTSFPFGRVKLVPASHGSGIIEGEKILYGGNPCGVIIEVEGKKVYHAGDTGLIADMMLLKDEKIDLALLPIGGNFTMDLEDALKALDLIKPKRVIPMHYDTWPLIKADPEEFAKGAKERSVVPIVLKPGEETTI